MSPIDSQLKLKTDDEDSFRIYKTKICVVIIVNIMGNRLIELLLTDKCLTMTKKVISIKVFFEPTTLFIVNYCKSKNLF